MKKIIKSVFAIIGILTLASCSSTEEIFTENVDDKSKTVKMTFTASQENSNATRTAIGTEDGKTKIYWSDGDAIKVFNGTSSNTFNLTDKDKTNATFAGEITESENYYAIYPIQDGVTCSANKFSGVQLKSEQTAVDGSFDPTAAIMVAKNSGKNFSFKNVIAYFKITPTFNCSEIVVTAHKSTDALAGTFDVTLGSDGKPSIDNITEGSREVKLKGDIKADTDYYILLLPGTFDYGFSVTLQPKSDSSKKYFKQRTTSFTLNSNDLWKLGDMSDATEVSESTIPYVKLMATVTQTITLRSDVEDATGLEYSIANGAWTTFLPGNTISFNNLRLRAKNKNGIRAKFIDNTYKVFTFGNETGIVTCSGDIRTLIDYENYYDANTSVAKFCGLFSGYTQLRNAPTLPIMELSNSCYREMFKGCTLFGGAPKLPATTLADNCYYHMFSGCTSLATSPALPATTLANSCYASMFYGCKGLTTAPELNMTTLANGCYTYMFAGCTSLTVAPKLPAAKLVPGCYFDMFYGCSKLEKVTMLATDISASGSLTNWLSGAGTEASNRTLKLASQSVYNEMLGIGSNLDDKWKQGVTNTTVEFQNP